MAGGRPTDYDPAYCDQVIEYGKQGKSRAWIAAKLDVVHQTLKNWEAVHPEFLEAMTRASQFSQMWWEDAGQVGMVGDKFNSSVWSRSMAARFPNDWREKVAHVGDKSEDPIQQEVTLTADDFTRRMLSAHARAAAASGTGEAADQDQG